MFLELNIKKIYLKKSSHTCDVTETGQTKFSMDVSHFFLSLKLSDNSKYKLFSGEQKRE